MILVCSRQNQLVILLDIPTGGLFKHIIWTPDGHKLKFLFWWMMCSASLLQQIFCHVQVYHSPMMTATIVRMFFSRVLNQVRPPQVLFEFFLNFQYNFGVISARDERTVKITCSSSVLVLRFFCVLFWVQYCSVLEHVFCVHSSLISATFLTPWFSSF